MAILLIFQTFRCGSSNFGTIEFVSVNVWYQRCFEYVSPCVLISKGGTVGGCKLSLTGCVADWVQITFLVLWILAESIRGDEGRQPQAHQGSLDFAANDLVKSMLSFSLWFVCRQLQGVRSLSTIVVGTCGSSESHLPTCNVPFHEHRQGFPTSRSCSNCRDPHTQSSIVTSTICSVRLTLSILVVALVYTLRAYTVYAATIRSYLRTRLSGMFP